MAEITIQVSRAPLGMSAQRYFRKPKGVLLLVLGGLALFSAVGSGPGFDVRGLVAAMGVAAGMDALLLRYMSGRWSLPDGALLTGLIVGMILSPLESWKVAAVTSAVGIFGKYLFRTRTANLFNPAALGLVATYYGFNPIQNWWGAMSFITPYAVVAMVIAGTYLTERVNRMPAVLSFFACYFGLFTVTAFVGDPARVAEIFRTPDLHAVVYLGFFMITDPPTSPPRPRDQLIFGAIAAGASYLAYEFIGAAYFLLAGLLIANIWEGHRRAVYLHARSRPHWGASPD
jgi:Na+-translocating ferredoxin:NAD+ oxidoreductase RnfD subunit